MRLPRVSIVVISLVACGSPAAQPQNVIQIEIDDHGLSALWDSDAPNLKGLIARGTFGYSRVQIPTHSNQGNYSTLTGQSPDGNDVPGNTPLPRPNFQVPISIAGQSLGSYAYYDQNPLLTRGDSTYRAAERLGIRPSYFGQIPPFDVGADDVHFTILDENIEGITVTASLGDLLLEGELNYPPALVSTFNLDGPAGPNESLSHFVFRDLANFISATTPEHPMPRYIYLWDFLALDGNPTDHGAEITASIEDYDDALGDVLEALDAKGLTENTNIVFTLDHGKINTQYQAALGTRGGDSSGPGDGNFGLAVAAQGPALGITEQNYQLFQEDGDVLLYAVVPNVGTAAAAAEQERVAHALVDLVSSGTLQGVDTTRTVTFDGYLGTRRFHDVHDEGPLQADIMIFGQPNWTLNQVDGNNPNPGLFVNGGFPYGRHGGLSTEELYVPFILSGPAFKKGVILPHPIDQADVAPTAMWALGAGYMTTAEGAPVLAAFEGQQGETLPQPMDMTTTQATILNGSGYGSANLTLGGTLPGSAVVVDVAGLYYDEVLTDQNSSLRDAAQPFLDLATQGTVFDHFWTRYRDWPVNEYEMLTGGYPVQLDYIPFAEDDPTQASPPGFGFLQMPLPTSGFIADQAGYQAWRQPGDFGVPTVFDAARAAGFDTALLGQLDFQNLHVDTSAVELEEQLDPGSIAGVLQGFLQSHQRSVVYVALGDGKRTADRHSPQAASELAALGETLRQIAEVSFGQLLLVTSRGATTIDDVAPDFYGPGTSRHVPLVAVGPNVRSGIVTSQDGQGADIPATVLVGLGLPVRTDFVDGTWAAGSPIHGIAQPTPAGATGGHALTRAFLPFGS